jgi:hypothetical protein
MVELNHRERTIKVKIVYYGPAIGGKTTNIQVLHQHALAARRGDMISINSAQDRTILFDLLPLKAAGFRGFDLRLQVLAIPGQAMYAATRRLVLQGSDAVVFVANSAADRWEDNLQSFREMTQNLIANQLDPAHLPLVLQYNKRDLPHITPTEVMDRALNARKVDSIPAVAVRGEGVLETFSAILMRTMQDLAVRYQIVEPARGQTLSQWTQATVVGMFGTTALATEPNPLGLEASPQAPPPPRPRPAPVSPVPPPVEPTFEWEAPHRRTVRVALPDEVLRMAGSGPDARANETLVESYVQAGAQLSAVAAELREERDMARRRLEDVQHALSASQEVLAGQPLEPTLRAVLGRMVEAAGATHATFLVPETDRTLRTAAMRGLLGDPLLRVPSGARHVLAKFLTETEPRLHLSADSLDLTDALEAGEIPLAAVLSVPVKTPRGLQGLAMLYYTPDAVLPRPEALAHLAVISRALSSSLELARALETVRSAERSLQTALTGTASVRGLDEVVAFLVDLRDRLGRMRQKPDPPPWFVSEFHYLAPSLAGALSTARSLLAFSRGQIEKEAVGVQELVAGLRTPGLASHFGAGVNDVSGDPVLLRLALAALLDHARGGSVAQPAPPLHLWVVSEGGRVKISVADADAAPRGSRGEADINLVRRIAELHGGSLVLENNGALGARYTINLIPG